MNIKELAKDHIKDAMVMQLATCSDNKSWVCNVHFLADDELNLYWISLLDCRHSNDIASNPRAAAAFAIQEVMPIVGVQVEGDVEQLEFANHKDVLEAYAKRHNRANFVEDALSGKMGLKKLFRLKPTTVQVFDFKNFPKDPKQQVKV